MENGKWLRGPRKWKIAWALDMENGMGPGYGKWYGPWIWKVVWALGMENGVGPKYGNGMENGHA
jgi:hypothetical protein